MHHSIARRFRARHHMRLAALELGAQQLAEQVVVAIPLPAPVERHHEAVRARERLERVNRPRRLRARRRRGRRTCDPAPRCTGEIVTRPAAAGTGARSGSTRTRIGRRRRSAAALAELGAPACIDSAARYRPAGQPSVRSVSSASSPGSSSTPAACSSNPASRSSSRRSATPTSCTPPCARQRASGSSGASRLAIAICEPAGTYSTSAASTSRQDRLATACRSSSTSTSGRSSAASALPTRGTRFDQRGSPRARQRIEDLGCERVDAMDRGGDVPQEHHGVVVSRVERRPRRTDADRTRPSRKQRCLAVPGGRDDGREARGRRAEPCDHVRLRHRAGPRRRRGELEL